jgi:aminoglycoside phosphotransferase family enzyme/predicted kinase
VELERLIADLSRPEAYPFPVEHVAVRQTHASVVFLAGSFAYKVKKPVDLGFLDFRDLARRQFFCAEEVRLNRRLAQSVYLGVVPVVEREGLRVEGPGSPVEWAVKMVRLPEEATLLARLSRDEVSAADVEELARRVAAFHAAQPGGPALAAAGRFEVVAANARDNLTLSAAPIGPALSPQVRDALAARFEEELARLRPLIEARAEAGLIRDTHGDLRLDHVYLFPGRAPPEDVVIVDCVEFNERFRLADPVADMAFLVMGLLGEGRPDLADALARAYIEASRDREGEVLLPFYTAYRAAVRAKVDGLKAREPEVPAEERAAALLRARGRWLLALGQLEAPARRPCLVLLAGLPGAGKSTLARALGERAGLTVVRSDVVRKEMAGPAPGEDIYTPEWTDRAYAECLAQAGRAVFAAGRALVDANFREEQRRKDFLAAARAWGVPGLVLLCRARPEVVRERLARRAGDASDADWGRYLELAREWEEPGEQVRRACYEIDCNGTPEEALAQALAALARAELVGHTR